MNRKDMFKEKVLLITGGTGSFGNAVLKRFLNSDIAEIRIFSRDEKKQHEMRLLYNSPKLQFYIGDVRNKEGLMAAMIGVDYVFHAAALKQVPSCEFFPYEATMTNVLGTKNVIESAQENGVSKVICLSTDKAAYPINAMGITKALMEKVAVASARNTKSETTICITRYGNVMGSRGSVIPLFIDQINSGNSITLTDPNMTRYLMSLDEAVDLVLYAFKNGKSGDLFVQKAPASTIGQLSEALMELFECAQPVDIIGTRHGEKLYETLCTREEMLNSEDLGDFFRIPCDQRGLNYGLYFSEGSRDLSKVDDYNSHNAKRLTMDEIKEKLLELDFVQSALSGKI